jgi:hypothetical protein
MKKIYFGLLVFLISASVSAGGWFQDFSSGRLTIVSDESTAPDDAWYVTGTSGLYAGSAWKEKVSFNYSGVERPGSSFIFLDGTGAPVGSFSVVSPAFTPVANEDLYYRIQEIKVADFGESVPVEIYVEIATKENGVWEWSTSTANVLAGLTNHNISTTDIVIQSESLSTYSAANKEIRIRFRGTVGLGDFVVAFYNVAVLNGTATDLAVSASQNVISQIPKKHAGQALNASSVSVQNLGQAVAGNTTTVTATASGNTVATASVPALQPLETSALTFDATFAPQSFAEYQFQYSLPEDANNANNTVTSNTFTVTPNTFASDKGTVYSYTNNANGDIGNKFTLTAADRVESISLGWAKLNSDPAGLDFQLVIYGFEANGDLNKTPVYTSNTFTRPSNATTPPNNRLATFESYPVGQDLDAGSYIFAVKKSANLGLGSEHDDNSVYYSIEDGQAIPTAGVSLLLRVNTASDITLSPAVATKTAGINEQIVIAGSAVTGFTGTAASITITKGDNTPVTVTDAIFADGKLTITHAPFEHNTAYTVTVAANTVTGYAAELSWSFTTVPSLAAATFSPANNATNIALNATVSVTFDRVIPDGNTLTGITIATDEETPVAVSGVSAAAVGSVLTIAHGPFERNKKYKVTIPAAAINELAADISWVFTTIPPFGLTTTSPFYPADGATDAELNTSIRVIFNQAVDTNSTLAGITINGTAVTASIGTGNQNNRVIIDRSGLTFQENTLYTVNIPAGAIAGYGEAITWSFTTFLTLEPVTFTPEKGSSAPADTEISIEFNKEFYIQSSTSISGGQPGEISIVTAGGRPLKGVSYAIDSENPKKLVISHDDILVTDTVYKITVPDNIIGSYQGVSDWTFTATAPTLSVFELTPAEGAENVGAGNLVEVTFNRTIDTTSTTGITINGVAPNSVNFQSTGNGLIHNKLRLIHNLFVQGTQYTVTIPAGSVTGYDREISWSFTVPVLAYEVSPADGATGVALDASVKIGFNRPPLRPRLGSAVIAITGDDGSEITTAGNYEVKWNASYDTLTISHTIPFNPEVTYDVNIVATSIVDYTDWNGESSIVWSFTTGQNSGIQTIDDAASSVYPALTKGDITVVSAPGSLIKIVDIAGVTHAVYRSAGKETPIRLNGANGLYLVVIQNGKSGLTYKVVLQQ